MRVIEGVSRGASEVVLHWQRQRQKRCLQRCGRFAEANRRWQEESEPLCCRPKCGRSRPRHG